MGLTFPNENRCFEAGRDRVRFWGHDSALEITFFIPAETLMEICSGTERTEADLLAAFDSSVEQIHRAASNVYGRGRNRSYVHVLTTNDL